MKVYFVVDVVSILPSHIVMQFYLTTTRIYVFFFLNWKMKIFFWPNPNSTRLVQLILIHFCQFHAWNIFSAKFCVTYEVVTSFFWAGIRSHRLVVTKSPNQKNQVYLLHNDIVTLWGTKCNKTTIWPKLKALGYNESESFYCCCVSFLKFNTNTPYRMNNFIKNFTMDIVVW